MITIATLFWQPNWRSLSFSSMYDESWVEKLYRGFERNLSVPFEFVCYTDRDRRYSEPIKSRRIRSKEPGYADCIQPYEMNKPMILVGLDTVITGNIDHLAEYALTEAKLALPRDPYQPARACNGVALVPRWHSYLAYTHSGENDMDWLRAHPHVFIDDLFPGQVQSYKGAVRDSGLGDSRIVYFHGHEKPHEVDDAWVQEHWR